MNEDSSNYLVIICKILIKIIELQKEYDKEDEKFTRYAIAMKAKIEVLKEIVGLE